MSPLVSIITVNFRQKQVTCELLTSIYQLSFKDVEVILVDNGMVNDEEPAFRECFPAVRMIKSKENLGFAGGNNLGLRAAKGAFFLLVNNDTEIKDGFIENLLQRFTEPRVGVVCPKIRYFHSPEIIQYAGFSPINPLTGRNTAIGKGERDYGQYDRAHPVPYAHGAAMMLRREVVQKVGGMSEAFFLYYEELDWCEQIRRAGYEIWYEPSAMILHKESVATGKESPLKTYYLTRNRILFMRRNFRGFKLAAFLIFYYSVSFPVNILRLLKAGKFPQLKAFSQGSLMVNRSF